MRIYKLYGSATTTGVNIANVQILGRGRIKQIAWSASYDGPADNASAAVELSFQQVSTIGQSNVAGPIDEIRTVTNLTTSGAPPGFLSRVVPVDCPVGVGDILYLNCLVSGTVSCLVNCFVHVQEGA